MVGEKPKYAMAFFDGQNLFRHAKDAFGHHHPNFDPIKLHKMVCASKGWAPNLVRFYTGVPRKEKSPMWADYWSNRILAMDLAESLSQWDPALRDDERHPDRIAERLEAGRQKTKDLRLGRKVT